MDGKTLKLRIQKIEPSMAELARKLDILPQSLNQTLNAADIKTGFIEQLVATLNKPTSFFFGEEVQINDHSKHDDHSAWFGSESIHYENCNNESLIAQIKIEQNKVASLQKQISNKDETISALRGDIESKQKMIDYLLSKK